ncbi:hypothetical protein Agabi119p4_11062 [Agaricus bisporus var. burnettii]|uniref:F-box domain-containing protein n=1 Tax=Agaricus bisporus var. burnettii TaxID=192524 RepID=A0A8H7C1Q6_AGABI|nr:hypothetical protein Agabi119p4_11062 [Agaricus bisporus var. burnettii]
MDTVVRRSQRIKKNPESRRNEKADVKPVKTKSKTRTKIKFKTESKIKSEAQTNAGIEAKSKYAWMFNSQPINEIPLDTLHDILRLLDPIDLLHLSWVNKSMNLVFMERSARYIWKEALARLFESDGSPPPCPEDLNFAQYTRFLFHRKCMVCPKTPFL